MSIHSTPTEESHRTEKVLSDTKTELLQLKEYIENNLYSTEHSGLGLDQLANDSLKNALNSMIEEALQSIDKMMLEKQKTGKCCSLKIVAKSISYPIMAILATFNLFGLTSVIDPSTGQANYGQIALRMAAALGPAAMYLVTSENIFGKISDWITSNFSHLTCTQQNIEAGINNRDNSAVNVESIRHRAARYGKTTAILTVGLFISAWSVVLDAQNSKSGANALLSLTNLSESARNAISTLTGTGTGLVEGAMPLVNISLLLKDIIQPSIEAYTGSPISKTEMHSFFHNLLKLSEKKESCDKSSDSSGLSEKDLADVSRLANEYKQNKQFRNSVNNYLRTGKMNSYLSRHFAGIAKVTFQIAIMVSIAWFFGTSFSSGLKLKYYQDQLASNVTTSMLKPYPDWLNVVNVGSYGVQGLALSKYCLVVLENTWKLLTSRDQWPSTRPELIKRTISVSVASGSVVSYCYIASEAANVLHKVHLMEAASGIDTSVLAGLMVAMGPSFNIILLTLLFTVLFPEAQNVIFDFLTFISETLGFEESESTSQLTPSPEELQVLVSQDGAFVKDLDDDNNDGACVKDLDDDNNGEINSGKDSPPLNTKLDQAIEDMQRTTKF
ncbi:MAG: hypothetical protein ACPGEF_02945 [Endozoicomonas sp.]